MYINYYMYYNEWVYISGLYMPYVQYKDKYVESDLNISNRE